MNFYPKPRVIEICKTWKLRIQMLVIYNKNKVHILYKKMEYEESIYNLIPKERYEPPKD